MLNYHVSKVIVGGIIIDALSRKEWAEYMVRYCKDENTMKPYLHSSANGQVLALCAADPSIKKLYDEADGIAADGQSLVLASRVLTRTPLPERVATTDFFHDAAEAAQREGLSFYLLGSTQENIEIAVRATRQLYPNLRIAGYRNGYVRAEDEGQVVKEIVDSNADVLWIGMGVPKQLDFAVRNRNALSRVKWIKTCGGLFDYFNPRIKRAPLWMQRCGLEWLFRTVQEPKKFFWRYLSTNGRAAWLLMTRTSAYP